MEYGHLQFYPFSYKWNNFMMGKTLYIYLYLYHLSTYIYISIGRGNNTCVVSFTHWPIDGHLG